MAKTSFQVIKHNISALEDFRSDKNSVMVAKFETWAESQVAKFTPLAKAGDRQAQEIIDHICDHMQ